MYGKILDLVGLHAANVVFVYFLWNLFSFSLIFKVSIQNNRPHPDIFIHTNPCIFLRSSYHREQKLPETNKATPVVKILQDRLADENFSITARM